MDGSRAQDGLNRDGFASLIRPRAVVVALWTTFGCVTIHAVHGLLGGSAPLLNDWLYNGVLMSATCICLSRGVLVPSERAAWLMIGTGLASWTVGDLYWTLHLANLDTVPFPSIADAFYLVLYPALYTGIVLLVRARVLRFHRSLWLDGAIGALGTAALGSAILYPVFQSAIGGDPATVATNLAYPLGDLLLLSLVMGVVALTGWRPGRAWVVLGAGLVANAMADGAFLYLQSTGSYAEGGLTDSLWLVGALLIAYAAWCGTLESKRIRLDGLRLIFVPSLFALASLVLLAEGALFGSLNRLSLGLATATLFVALVRMMIFSRENMRLAEATERASRAKSDFLANMSHELRTPLTAIIGYSEMFLDGLEMTDEERIGFASRILSNGQHLHGLINDLLDLSKVEAGMMDFRSERVDIADLLEEIELTIGVLAHSNRVEFRTLVSPDLREVVTDRSKLKQVLLNYLSNAIKFTPPGGQVTLVLEPEGEGQFRLTVEDTGIGISAENQQRLFRVFQQTDLKTAAEQQGTGLGLALVKRIAEAQGGSVGLQSEPGRGSTFFAVLPTQAVPHQDAPSTVPVTSRAGDMMILPVAAD
jgi:signal transduction histidine kinase